MTPVIIINNETTSTAVFVDFWAVVKIGLYFAIEDKKNRNLVKDVILWDAFSAKLFLKKLSLI